MMSQPRFPDPTRSRAVLIGPSHFTAAGPDLPDIPAVEANLTALRQVLTSPDTGVLRPESCRVLIDSTSVDEVGTALSDLTATATDLLLVYYAGHGLVDARGRLHLALAHTHPCRARWTALPVELLREEIATSAAATRVLVLDCCFSGRAIEAMADNQGVITGQLEVAGTYTLTSTTANAPSHAPAGTGLLLSLARCCAHWTKPIRSLSTRSMSWSTATSRRGTSPVRNVASSTQVGTWPSPAAPPPGHTPSRPTPTRHGSPARTAH